MDCSKSEDLLESTSNKLDRTQKKESRNKQKLTPPTKQRQHKLPVGLISSPGRFSRYNSGNVPQKQRLIPPGSLDSKCHSPTLRNISKATYERLKQQPQHRRMGPTTSALVRPAPPFSRPPPGAALRVMPPKKRVKLDEDEEEDIVDNPTKKKTLNNVSRHQEDDKSRRDAQKSMPKSQLQSRISNQSRGSKPLQSHLHRVADKNKSRQLPRSSRRLPHFKASNSAISCHSPSRPNPSFEKTKPKSSIPSKKDSSIVCNSVPQETSKPLSFHGVKFKKLKKANMADQLKRSKEGKLDLMSPDSILTSVQIKTLLNGSAFRLLPPAYQYQLLMLLPKCDRITTNEGDIRLSSLAMNNAFFTRACQEFKDKLIDGEFNSDIIQRAKNEVQLNTRLDPWKAKFFEPVYGSLSVPESSSPEKHDKKNEVDAHGPALKLEPVESSWVTFLKFADNSSNDFEEALTRIQSGAQKILQAGTPKTDSNKMKDVLGSKSKKLVQSTPSVRSSNIRTVEGVNKEKSKRALRKAQILQRKKAFDKQLKAAKAKLVEEARFSARKDDVTGTLQGNSSVKQQAQHVKTEDNSHKVELLGSTDAISTKQISKTPNVNEKSTLQTQEATRKPETADVINLCDSLSLKRLIKSSEQINPPVKQKRKPQPRSLSASKIQYGPSAYGVYPDGKCLCNLKAMVVCKQCGSFWHSDCVGLDEICILCTN